MHAVLVAISQQCRRSASLGRCRLAGNLLLVAWLWAAVLSPLLHSWQHQLDHVHTPFGIRYLARTGQPADALHAGSHTHTSLPLAAHRARHAAPDQPRSRGPWQQAHDALGLALGGSAVRAACPKVWRAAGEPHTQPALRLARDSGERTPNQPNTHGDGAPEHFRAAFLAPEPALSPPALALVLQHVIAGPSAASPALEDQRWLERSRGPPRLVGPIS